jgi:hypothetical protein
VQVKARQAFSMVELLIVLVLAGFMLTMSTSTLLAVRRNALVRGAIDEAIAKHSLARATAVRMGRLAQLRADPAGGRLWIEVGGAPIPSSGTRLEGVHFTTNRTILCFDARGLATMGGACQSPDATFVFKHTVRSDTLRMTLLGRIVR